MSKPSNWKCQQNIAALAAVLHRRTGWGDLDMLHYQVDSAMDEVGLKPVKLTSQEKAARAKEHNKSDL